MTRLEKLALINIILAFVLLFLGFELLSGVCYGAALVYGLEAGVFDWILDAFHQT